MESKKTHNKKNNDIFHKKDQKWNLGALIYDQNVALTFLYGYPLLC